MAVENPLIADGSTRGHIASSLARDIHNSQVANDFSLPSPLFGDIKSCFINKNELMRRVSDISFKYSLLK